MTTTRSPRPAPPTAPADLDATMGELARTLAALYRGYGALHQTLEKMREAIRTADAGAILACCEEERTMAEGLMACERQRACLVEAAAAAAGLDEPVAAGDLERLMPEGRRTAYRKVCADLRRRVDDVRTLQSIVSAAGTALHQHITGVMQTVHAALTEGPVYTARGRMATTPARATSAAVDYRQ